jgi:succinate-semialdehyde dehydrogenase/glutarate-semialdehyde dehydrogenase
MAKITTINPATGALLKEYACMSSKEIDAILGHMQEAYHGWRAVSVDERVRYVRAMATHLETHCEQYARAITEEMGKPITQAEAEIQKCAHLCSYYADVAKAYLEPEYVKTEYSKSYRSFQPIGIIFASQPWNFPVWQVFRFAIPNLLLGNAGLLRHANNCVSMERLS